MSDEIVKKYSEIKLKVGLNSNNIPLEMHWSAADGDVENAPVKAVLFSVWDPIEKNTMKIDLWTKDMPVEEMKRFYIDCLGGLAQSALTSTGDEYISNEINSLCEKLVKHIKKENKG